MAGQVVVTGGAGCIGLAICRRILAAGQIPVALDLAPAIAAVDWDSPQARGIVPLAGDVTDRASIEAAARELSPAEPLAGLVNCAGVLKDTYLGQMSDAAMNLMFQVNVAGTARVTDVFAPLLADGSAIVNIGSLTGHIGRLVGASVYGATKAGVSAYTTYLAVELAARKIRVNCIAPGVIRAPMSPSMAAISGGEEASAAHTILGRIGEPEEVAEVTEFLLSARASYITAQTILVDGGFVAQ
ncbi:MAG TPA: SDR family oxidoreductase [Streptosporangiaceae bacterium]|jgi:3-oxoacyl-[acyl-carrier protein] reductase